MSRRPCKRVEMEEEDMENQEKLIKNNVTSFKKHDNKTMKTN